MTGPDSSRRLSSWTRDGLRFDVRDTGPDDGETVVCLHGFPQDSTAYAGVSPLLTEAGLRVLVPDQRGYSPGARPMGRASYLLRELAADVVALLDAAGVQRAHVVGHDWGGAVAWMLASRSSDRVRSLTALSTPHPAAQRAAFRRSSQGLRSAYMALFQVPFLPELVSTAGGGALTRAGLRASGLDGARADHYAARMQEPGAMTAALAWYRAIPLSGGSGPGRVRVPTTYVVGRRDPFFSGAAVTGTRELATGPFRLVELDAGHWLPESHPLAVADAVVAQVRSSLRRAR